MLYISSPFIILLFEYKIQKDVITEINKYVALGSEDNPFSLVNKLEYSFDGTEVSYTGYPSGNVFFKIYNEFYSNGLVKESKYYPWNGDNGKVNEDYYEIFRFDENGKITENIIESPYQSSIGKATLTYENGTYNGEYYAKNSNGEYVKSFDITYVLDQYERLTYHVGQYCTETYIYDEGGNYFYSYEIKEEAYH